MRDDLQAYIRYLAVERGLSPSTLEAYERDLASLIDFLSGQGVNETAGATRHHLARYMLRQREQGRSAATLSRQTVSIRSFFQHLVREGKLAADPSLHLEAPRKEPKPPAVLAADAVGRLLDAPPAGTPSGIRDRAMLEVLYATGLRVGELTALDTDHIHPELGYLRCSGGGRERIVPLGRPALEAIGAYLREARPLLAKAADGAEERALFLNRRGTRITRQGFWKIIKKYASDAGIGDPVTPHTLRHSFAAHLLANGADLRSVQEMMGHADPATTQLYVQAAKTRMKDVYDRSHPRAK